MSDRASGLPPAAADALAVAGWFLVSGAVGALVWWQVTDLPRVTREDGTVVVQADQLVKQVGIDGWFAVIAVFGGLVGGIVLTAWRHRDPLLSVGLVALGALVAAWLMERLGLLLGPSAEKAALARLGEEGSVPMQLMLHAPGIFWLWPLAAMVGATAWLWIVANPDEQPA